MRRAAFPVLVVALLAALASGPAIADDQAAAVPTTQQPASLLKVFKVFSDLTSLQLPRLPWAAKPPLQLKVRQPGDADSVISPGAQTLSREVALKPAFEINDILLKAYTPNSYVQPGEWRFRTAGAFSPLDEHGRPYQFRLGARFVW